jgi:hypothetical protein
MRMFIMGNCGRRGVNTTNSIPKIEEGKKIQT